MGYIFVESHADPLQEPSFDLDPCKIRIYPRSAIDDRRVSDDIDLAGFHIHFNLDETRHVGGR